MLTVAHRNHDPSDNRDDGAKRAANRKRYQRWDQERAGQLAMGLDGGGITEVTESTQ